MASELLRKLLEQNKYLRASRIVRWPSRDRHQLWATAWLALRLLPGHAYSASELEALVERRLVTPESSLLFAVRTELQRRGFAVAAEGECEGVCEGEHEGECPVGALSLSRPAVDFLLDGDKLFLVRLGLGLGLGLTLTLTLPNRISDPNPNPNPNPDPDPNPNRNLLARWRQALPGKVRVRVRVRVRVNSNPNPT